MKRIFGIPSGEPINEADVEVDRQAAIMRTRARLLAKMAAERGKIRDALVVTDEQLDAFELTIAELRQHVDS